MMVRCLAVTIVLGLTLWLLTSVDAESQALVLTLSILIVLTYLMTIVFGLLLRQGVPAHRLVWPQLLADVPIAALLLYCTGGATSAYSFFFALTLVSAGALLYQRGVLTMGVVSLVVVTVVAIAAWQRWLPLPMLPQARPWEQTGEHMVRSLGINLAAIGAVGVLAYAFAEQLQRTRLSLASEQRTVADLVTRSEDILRSLSSGLVTVDMQGTLLTANRVAGEIFGHAPSAMIGRPIADVFPPLAERLAPLAAEATVQRGDVEFRRDERPAVLGISVTPLRDVAGQATGRVINFTDLTTLRAMEVQVRRAERMATVGELAAGIAHEIRNPLASISGSIELLRSSTQATEDDRTLMAIVIREIERLNRLITDLLDYANPRPRQLVEFDLARMVAETTHVFRQDPAVNANVIVEGVDGPPILIKGDASQLRQVMWNLLRNAADALASPGDSAPAGPGTIEVRVLADDAHAVVEVLDNGPGIPADALPRVFDPFFTTKKTGSGLGLAVCHAVVMDHGGSIDVRNRSPRGIRFVIRLPNASASAGANDR